MSRNKLKFLCMAIIVGIISCNISVKAMAAPLSECYTYPSTGLTTDMYAINININGAGYDNHSYTNTNAYYVRRTMGSDAIFYISTHGYSGGGRVACYDSSGANTSQLSAEAISDSTNYSLAALYGGNTSALSSIRLSYWSACQSAQTNASWGNLPSKACYYGARTSVGFLTDIGNQRSTTFDTQFFYYAKQGYMISDSLSKALADTRYTWGDDGGTSSYSISYRSGLSANQYLTPASYGY